MSDDAVVDMLRVELGKVENADKDLNVEVDCKDHMNSHMAYLDWYIRHRHRTSTDGPRASSIHRLLGSPHLVLVPLGHCDWVSVDPVEV